MGLPDLDNQYRIVTLGLQTGMSSEHVAAQLAALFKCERAQVKSLLAGEGVVVKRSLGLPEAAKYKQVLAQCGLLTSIEPELSEQPSFASAQSALRECNFQQAKFIYISLAVRGDATATYNLAAMYSEGGGLPTDLVEASKWMGVAADSGDPEAANVLARLHASMSWAEVANARQRTRAWLARYRRGIVSAAEQDSMEKIAAQGRYSVADMGTLLPRLRRAGSPGARALAGDLAVAYYFKGRDGEADLTQDALDTICLPPDGLQELAANNLYRIVQPALEIKQVPAAGLQDAGAAAFHQLATGDALEAACLLAAPVWEGVQPLVTGPLRILVAHAGSCTFCGAGDAPALAAMLEHGRSSYAQAGEAGLSALLYTVSAEGQLTCLDDALGVATSVPVTAPAAAAPVIAPLETPRTGFIPAAPGELTLSIRKLIAIEPQLNDKQRWRGKGDMRKEIIESFARQLRTGDARAAVVLDPEAGIVAAYTDELDCVVLLRFDAALIAPLGWKEGTRLLTINGYTGKEDGLAPDLAPAPGCSSEFGNVRPLIGELLSDDTNALDLAKARIRESEWERAAQLGRQLYREGTVAPRDGAPLRCTWPGKPRERVGAPADGAAGARADTVRVGVAAAGALMSFLMVWLASRSLGGMARGPVFAAACAGIVVLSVLGMGCSMLAFQRLRQRKTA